ncbi:MAG: SAM-dependent methyltransferase, partial [Verrucomicrobiota bacterium]
MATSENKTQHILLCRTGFESVLAEELRNRIGPVEIVSGQGWIALDASLDLPPLIFERQRILHAGWVSNDRLKPIETSTVREVFQGLSTDTGWVLHAYAEESTSKVFNPRRIVGIEKAMLRLLKAEARDRFDLQMRFAGHRCRQVLQLFLTENGLWHGAGPVDGLSAPFPAGRMRMKMDRDAPSRSFLKMEEAFARMGECGQPGQRVLDLGAAPGGWTYAFLKRGCEVEAVDHGPLKLTGSPPEGGSVKHIREDGLSYRPAQPPLDWLVCDMLVSPGTALGQLKKWIKQGWAHRIVCNMKLPQKNPWIAVQPIEAFLG